MNTMAMSRRPDLGVTRRVMIMPETTRSMAPSQRRSIRAAAAWWMQRWSLGRRGVAAANAASLPTPSPGRRLL